MSLIDRVKEQFTRQPVRVIEVPEWADEDGKPLLIYVTPLTLSEKQRLQTIGEEHGYIARLAHVLVMKARDEQGKALFTIADKHALMHSADTEVIARVVNEIMKTPSVEDAVKN